MHIDGWHIDGFGVFHAYTHRGLGPGLTVFLGPNEAGKSTLLAFLRGVLVGYPPRLAAAHYPPLNGGTHGGRVFLKGPDGEVTVERMVGTRAPQVLFPDGMEAGEEAVRRLLGGVDSGLFKSVFAFSLSELQDLESLTGEGVRDRIFSAGIAGAGRSAREVISRLKKDADGLLRPRKGGEINDLMGRLLEAEASATEARLAAAGYADLLAAEAEAEVRMSTTRERLDALRIRSDELRLLLDLWESQYLLDEAAEELARSIPVEELPAGSGDRLAQSISHLEAVKSRADEIAVGLSTASSDAATVSDSVDPTLEALGARVDDVSARMAVYRDRRESQPELGSALRRIEESVGSSMAELGPDWDESRVRGCDVSIARIGEVRVWKQRLEASARVVEEADRLHRSARERLEQVVTEADRIRGRLEQMEVPDGADVDRLSVGLADLRSALGESQAAEARLAGLRTGLEERERTIIMLQTAGARARDGRLVPSILGAVAVVAAAGALVLGLLVDRSWGLVMGAVALAAGLAAVAMRMYPRVGPADPTGLASGLADDRRTVEREETALAHIRARVDSLAADLGLTESPGWGEIERAESRLSHVRGSLKAYEETRERLREADDEVDRVRTDVVRKCASADEARAVAEGVAAEWDSWKAGADVPAGLDVEGAADFLRKARETRDLLRSCDEAAERVRESRSTCAAWEEAARGLLVEAGYPVSALDAESLVRSVVELGERYEADRRLRERLVILGERVRQLEARSLSAQLELAEAEAERDAVLDEAGVADEAEFQARVIALADRREIEARVCAASQTIAVRLGKGPKADTLRSELETGAVDEWRREADRVDREREEVELQSTAAIRAHRDAESERQALESSSDVPTRELEVTDLRERLGSALRRWQVLTAARLLIEDTLAEYARTRQPPVLREASDGLSQVTAGSYRQIIERDDAEGFVVVDRTGGLKRPEDLSRGTLEQLYLSLRLGLAREFGRRATAVPVIMDDVLVNFDPDRARATARVLSDFADEHQVLFFTCHPATADLLREVDPSVDIVELGGTQGAQGTLWGG